MLEKYNHNRIITMVRADGDLEYLLFYLDIHEIVDIPKSAD